MVEITPEMKELIEKEAIAFATVDKDGNPHCITVACCKVVSDNQILITNNYLVETIENITNNPNVALTVWSRNWEEEGCKAYELRGTAEYFTKGNWYDRVKQLPENKGYPCRGAILATVSRIKKLA
ncbi:MAG: pyridoxamine 5'-phosphate oxidase family protein [Candidatus Woesearchaeota archaeon]|nr:MAG: pyridoxamine 5'-phosphate oxidase family protein [Candidatus Woesearchaeota archaeon]